MENEYDDRQTRNSTFSKASEGREEIQKKVVSIEKAFIKEKNIGFLHPLDTDCENGNNNNYN